MSRTLRPLALALVAAVFSVGASCDREKREEARAGTGAAGPPPTAADPPADLPAAPPPAADRVEVLPQVDLADLTDGERELWATLVNDLLSPCGEPISVARCVVAGRGCARCVAAARYVRRLVAEGYAQPEIEGLYRLRYSPATRVELQTDHAPGRGAPMARVTLVEFSDFECPHCAAAHPLLKELVRELEGRVRVVFMNYPLDAHTHAVGAARAAVAAGRQGKFWEMHDLLFARQDALEVQHLEGYARELGLDVERFSRDLASDEVRERVEADKAHGEALGVSGTPTIFVNGRLFDEPLRSLRDYVQEELDE